LTKLLPKFQGLVFLEHSVYRWCRYVCKISADDPSLGGR